MSTSHPDAYPGNPQSGATPPGAPQYGAPQHDAHSQAAPQYGAPQPQQGAPQPQQDAPQAQYGAPQVQHGAPPQYGAGQPAGPGPGAAPQHGGPQYGAGQPAGAPAAGGGAGASDGLDPKIGGLLAYFTWVGGLAMYLTQKHREVRFHAAQSILFSISLFLVWVVLWTAEFFLTWIFSGFGLLTWFLFPLVGLASFVLWIILAIRGYNLVHFKLPIIGDMAEKWAAK